MYVTRDGVNLFYQATGTGARDLFLLPQCQPAAYSRQWKSQVPYLSRYFRVVTMDMRGNGRSDRTSSGYDLDTRYGDFLAVLEASVRPPFALVALSCAALVAFRYAVEHPDRLSHLILLSGQYAESVPQPFDEKVAPVIRDQFDAWRQRLFARCLPEPHSLKGMEDAYAWAGETTPDVLVESLRAIDGSNVYDLLSRLTVPTLALHGTLDKIVPYSHAEKMVGAIPGARLVTFEGAGHFLHGRHAVKVNHLVRDFVGGKDVASARIPATTERKVAEPAPARAPRTKERRILWLSSPIGLGHIQRDLAIARALRAQHGDVTVDFLAADPADRVVEACRERLHPATRHILNESAHVEGWAGDHELHAFNALWDMDEIMAANFMTFADVVERERYDLWVGDEGWDLDYYLHENPELKRAPYVFMTDFIGMLPMRDDPNTAEFKRAWDRNAENVDHLRFHPDVRDLSIMVGDEDDVLDRPFGPDLPNMREWSREHFRFSGYTYHFDPAELRDKTALRHELGFRPDERVILVSVGGTKAGQSLLRKCAQAFSLVAPRVPDARMLLVAGPRLDGSDFPKGPGIEVRSFVPNLFRHHAAAHLAIVQGGLTTTMELAAFQTPFLYFPLRNHFEQSFHVARRLDRLGAGVRMDYDRTSVEELGSAIVEHLDKPVQYRDAPTGGTERAARLIAQLL
ncbi:MAG TPA: alpha/beta fold hydrolase [Verrucomicrobiae bacterium]|jgi:pimeloyl-ACP methyl ester carboxylesterase/predicted glycosyltransferase|nr:alpha/beta fold hydrolase [Verrucomicrobiae bacterium]